MGARDEVGVAARLQAAHESGADHAAVAGDVDFPVGACRESKPLHSLVVVVSRVAVLPDQIVALGGLEVLAHHLVHQLLEA